ncbi:hypothetical protein L7F22_067984 [Adiantum nelumboides]|nr:hypothetical protein [Adiantum nelumboides]
MFTGTTTLCVASSLPSDGKVVCLEIDQYFEDLARPYFEKAGVSSKIDVKVGKALDFLQSYDGEPFDLIFIDADKTGYLGYFNAIFDRGLLSKSGVLLVDNVLYKGLPITDGLQSESTAERVDNGGALKHFNQSSVKTSASRSASCQSATAYPSSCTSRYTSQVAHHADTPKRQELL